jgi:hypothetical protein
MEEALIALLKANGPLTALLGDNIYWVDRFQGSGLPALTLTRITGVRGYVMTGADGMVTSRIQCDCDALTYATAKAIARALRDALSGLSGTFSGVQFQGCFIDGGDRDTFETAETTDKIFRTSIDYQIFHKES